MGSPAAEAGRHRNEGPQVGVSIAKPFAVSRREITFDEWETCALEGGCNKYRPKDAGWGRGRRPVTYVSYDDARAYVAWLSQKTGATYRLLSESEWEYAARAGTTTPFETGLTITTAEANFDAPAPAAPMPIPIVARPSRPGPFPQPLWPLRYSRQSRRMDRRLLESRHAGAPGDGSARGGDCSRRVVKGGAWYFELSYARAAARMSYPADKRLNVVGFRVVRDL